MIQRRIDETADRYMMLTNSDRRLKLGSIKRADKAISTFGFVLFILTLVLLGIAGWTSFFASGHGAGSDGLQIEHIFFPILIYVEIAIGRTAKSSVPMWIILVTSVFATIATYGIYIYFVVYSMLFTFVEIKMAAMKNVPGYPAFEDARDGGLGKHMTADQMSAYEKKMFADMADKEGARARDSANLDKILSGEMELDEFLGVEKIDARNAKMDEVAEYHEPEATVTAEPDGDDDSAEAFFRRFEKSGGSLSQKKDESVSWLEGGAGDANSAESYFGNFEKNGGKLGDETIYKPKITFDKVIKAPKAKKEDCMPESFHMEANYDTEGN